MESLVSGTLAGTGSFRCEECGEIVTMAAADTLAPCPKCSGTRFARASLFATGRFERLPETTDQDVDELRSQVRELTPGPGRYLAWRDGEQVQVQSLEREWTRIGRSLAADVRFDDPTVSRRHALIVRQADGVRVLDDRSLNGVFVNGERVEWHVLQDGDEVVVGRHRLTFLEVVPTTLDPSSSPLTAGA